LAVIMIYNSENAYSRDFQPKDMGNPGVPDSSFKY